MKRISFIAIFLGFLLSLSVQSQPVHKGDLFVDDLCQDFNCLNGKEEVIRQGLQQLANCGHPVNVLVFSNDCNDFHWINAPNIIGGPEAELGNQPGVNSSAWWDLSEVGLMQLAPYTYAHWSTGDVPVMNGVDDPLETLTDSIILTYLNSKAPYSQIYSCAIIGMIRAIQGHYGCPVSGTITYQGPCRGGKLPYKSTWSTFLSCRWSYCLSKCGACFKRSII